MFSISVYSYKFSYLYIVSILSFFSICSYNASSNFSISFVNFKILVFYSVFSDFKRVQQGPPPSCKVYLELYENFDGVRLLLLYDGYFLGLLDFIYYNYVNYNSIIYLNIINKSFIIELYLELL